MNYLLFFLLLLWSSSTIAFIMLWAIEHKIDKDEEKQRNKVNKNYKPTASVRKKNKVYTPSYAQTPYTWNSNQYVIAYADYAWVQDLKTNDETVRAQVSPVPEQQTVPPMPETKPPKQEEKSEAATISKASEIEELQKKIDELKKVADKYLEAFESPTPINKQEIKKPRYEWFPVFDKSTHEWMMLRREAFGAGYNSEAWIGIEKPDGSLLYKNRDGEEMSMEQILVNKTIKNTWRKCGASVYQNALGDVKFKDEIPKGDAIIGD